jgi:putative effector of murein hydrolase
MKGKEKFFSFIHRLIKWGGGLFLFLLVGGPAWPSITDFLEYFPASKIFFLALTAALIVFAIPLYKRIQSK